MPAYEKIHLWQDPKQVREALVYAAGFGHEFFQCSVEH